VAKVTVIKSRQPSHLHRLVDDYLMECRARGLAPGTINNSYGYPVRSIFLPWCDEHGIEEPAQLDGRTINAFSVALQEHGGRRGQGLSKFSIHAYTRAVRGFLTWCSREGEAITARPALPRLPRRVLDVLDRHEIDALEAAAPTERDRLIIRILGDCGLRAEGLCGLRVDDVVRRDRQAYLRVREKNDREREVPLSPGLLRRLERYISNGRPNDVRDPHLFVGLRRARSGEYEPLTRSGVLQLVRNAADRAGISKRVHTHLLRHSFITNALRAGMNPLILAKIAGHSSLRMIDQVYSHLNTTDTYEAMIRMLNETESRRQ
jgi:integrase